MGRSSRPDPVAWVATTSVVILLAIGGLSTLSAQTPAAAPTFGPGPAADRPANVGPSPSNAASGIPGSDPRGEPFLSAPALALEEYRLEEAENASAASGKRAAAPPNIPPGPPPAERVSGSPGNGTVRGRLVDGQNGRSVALADVSMELAVGGCPDAGCPDGTSNLSGGFLLSAAPGLYVLTANVVNYVTNQTTVQVTANQSQNLGTILLTEAAWLVGTVLGSDPTHEPMDRAGIGVSMRVGNSPGGAGSATSNGSFRIEVDPGADRVDVSPPPSNGSRYASNFTFADPEPGATVDLGTIYLLAGTELNVSLVDRVTGQPIDTGLITTGTVYEAQTGIAAFPSTIGQGPNLTLFADPGPTVLEIDAIGYVQNDTPIGIVPAEPDDHEISVRVFLTPLGIVNVTADISGGYPYDSGWGTSVTKSQWWIGTSPTSNITGLDVCSLDGVDVGVIAPGGFIVGEPCFPGILVRFGGSTYTVGPPLRDWVEIGSFLGAAPMFMNETWVNLTPDRITSTVLDFTPGGYISGSVYYLGGPTPTTGPFTAQACSTDEPAVCGAVWYNPLPVGSNEPHLDEANLTAIGCSTQPEAFCVSAPPGPDEITVEGVDGSVNRTWAEVPLECCANSPHALALNTVTTTHIQTINLSALVGAVYGRVVGGPAELAPPFGQATVQVCSVASTGAPCTSALATPEGNFNVTAPIGWDSVTVLGPPYYGTNITWVNVTGNDSAGTIVVDAEATVTGHLVDPSGEGIAGGTLEYCTLAAAAPPSTGCTPFSLAATSSGGLYIGPVPGGPYPGDTYLLEANAPGYLANFTWFNATPGELVSLPPMVLTPVGAGVPAPPAAAGPVRPSTGSPGAWVDGRLVNAQTGVGIPDAGLTACTLTGSACIPFVDSTGTGGQFNDSVPIGTYYLSVTEPGYSSAQFFVNASSTAPVHLGIIELAPFAFVAGRVAIGPWVDLTKSKGLGPGEAIAEVCSINGTLCGPGGDVNTAGFYNVTAPPGFDALTINGTGADTTDLTNQPTQGTGSGGFVSNGTTMTVGSSDLLIGGRAESPMPMQIFTAISGTLWDGSTRASGGPPVDPAPWATLVANGPLSGSFVTEPVAGGGNYTVLVPPNEDLPMKAAGGAFRAENATFAVAPGAISVGGPAFDLTHFGWITTNLRSTTGAPVPFAAVTVSLPDPANRTNLVTIGTADGEGYVNVTAAAPGTVSVVVVAPGYGTENTTSGALPSTTRDPAVPPLPPTVTIEYLRSRFVNDLAGPTSPTVRDPLAGVAIGGAYVDATNGSGAIVEATVTSGLGLFLTSRNVSAGGALTIDRTGYEAVTLPVPEPVGGAVEYDEVNLTGDGVFVGQVVAAGNGSSVAGANVTACEIDPNGGCLTVQTNGAGVFWAEAPPGGYALTFSADGYDSNVTDGAIVSSDGWTWLGSVDLYADAEVTGEVVAAPFTDLGLEGAQVTVCPIDGSYSYYCALPTPTDPDGGFVVPSPPGLYYLNVSAPGYGPYSLEVELGIGELYDLGVIPLEPDGSVLGTVVTAGTNVPVAGASVTACSGVTGLCLGTNATGPTGFFWILGLAPGPATVEVSGAGYVSAYASVVVPAGETVNVGVIDLVPVGTIVYYDATGRIVWNSTDAGVAGATVQAKAVGGGYAGATVSEPNGSFVLALSTGAYELEATAPGAVPGYLGLAIQNASVGNLTIVLAESRYLVTGLVRVAGGELPLGGVLVTAGGVDGVGISNETGAGGSFQLELANGSYRVDATPLGPTLPGLVDAESTSVVVNGAGERLDLGLPERAWPVEIEVVAGLSGVGVEGAIVDLTGTSSFGVPQHALTATDEFGATNLTLPAGNYAASVNASGFGLGSVALVVRASATGNEWIVRLSSPTPAVGPAPVPWPYVGLAIAAVAAAGLAGFWTRGGRRQRTVLTAPEVEILPAPAGSAPPAPPSPP